MFCGAKEKRFKDLKTYLFLWEKMRRLKRFIGELRTPPHLRAYRKRLRKFGKEIGMKGVNEALIRPVFNITNSDPTKRGHGLAGLRRLYIGGEEGVKELCPVLTRLLEKETRAERRVSLLEGLVILGEKERLPELIETAKGLENPTERGYAVMAFMFLRDVRIIDELKEIKRSDPSPVVKRGASIALDSILA